MDGSWPDAVAFEAMVQHAPLGTLALDWDGNVMWASASMATLLGHPPGALIGTNALDLLHPDDRERARVTLRVMEVAHAPARGMVYRMLTSADDYEECLLAAQPHDIDGRQFAQIAVLATPVRLAVAGALAAVVGGASLEQSLAEIERTVARSLVGALVGINFVDPITGQRRLLGPMPPAMGGLDGDGGLDSRDGLPWAAAVELGAPQVCTSLDGLPPDVAQLATERGQQAVMAVAVDDPASGRAALVIGWVPIAVLAPAFVRNLEDTIGPVLTLIFERQHHLASLQRAAETDVLTALPNRGAFYRRLQATLGGSGGGLAVLYLDLDGFKAVNDRLGHAAGDAVLAEVARRVLDTLPSAAFAGRLGGDEFAVVVPEADPAAARAVAEHLLASISKPVELPPSVVAAMAAEHSEHSVQVGVSIGIVCSERGVDPDALVASADRALLEAKDAGRGVWRLGVGVSG